MIGSPYSSFGASPSYNPYPLSDWSMATSYNSPDFSVLGLNALGLNNPQGAAPWGQAQQPQQQGIDINALLLGLIFSLLGSNPSQPANNANPLASLLGGGGQPDLGSLLGGGLGGSGYGLASSVAATGINPYSASLSNLFGAGGSPALSGLSGLSGLGGASPLSGLYGLSGYPGLSYGGSTLPTSLPPTTSQPTGTYTTGPEEKKGGGFWKGALIGAAIGVGGYFLGTHKFNIFGKNPITGDKRSFFGWVGDHFKSVQVIDRATGETRSVKVNSIQIQNNDRLINVGGGTFHGIDLKPATSSTTQPATRTTTPTNRFRPAGIDDLIIA